MKKYIYLISPRKIKGNVFYNNLKNLFKTKKVQYFQLRLKNTKKNTIIKVAKRIKKITRSYKVKLIINDSPYIAKLVNAEGCHLGQNDMSLLKARKILGKNKIIGSTCYNSKKLAKKAINQGADYIAFGSFFKSKTKKTAHKASLSLLKNMKKNKKTTKVAIGGIDNYNYEKILLNGADFIAVSGNIWKNKNLSPLKALNQFKK